MRIPVISISAILVIFTFIDILKSAIKSESKKEGIAILLLIFEPVETVGYLFIIGLLGLVAGLFRGKEDCIF